MILNSAHAAHLPWPLPLPQRLIYGDDDRKDLFQVEDATLLGLADSTAAMFFRDDLTIEETPFGGSYRLNLRSLKETFHVCDDEPVADQLAGASCSGALVGPDLLLTAGHCVRTMEDCAKSSWVFGFALTRPVGLLTPQSSHVPASQVYRCASVVARQDTRGAADFALLRLDRAVTGRSPLSSDVAPVAPGTGLVVIGNPLGLPTKITLGGVARMTEAAGLLRAETDTYVGSSGSPVFHAATSKLIGILSGGDADFSYDFRRQCRISLRLPAGGGRGEEITPAEAFERFIEEAASRPAGDAGR